ncbi:MFS transporter [Amphibiibacter pelophylacis]|uniref:MFS transporter n=1 Tax=Amphibiibacter pelophylacis TaxID=1799477 RepID=A0ACC6P1I0_9BURK
MSATATPSALPARPPLYTQLDRSIIWFPLMLVLFEFSVYIGNDMIQPAMLTITQEYGADSAWVPTSMTLYLLGGAVLAWCVGPMSDRWGRRPVMLGGALLYALANFAILLAPTIEAFMAMRFVQGIALCFISAVGYVSIQEAFEEKTAIKVMALMANVAMVAPLLAPLLGAGILSHPLGSWQLIFVLIGAIALISLLGLTRAMPETAVRLEKADTLGQIGRSYLAVLRNRPFLLLALATPLSGLPLLTWIALSPLMLIRDMSLPTWAYGLAQVPVFAGLILGNITLARVTDRVVVGRTIQWAMPLMAVGAALLLACSLAGLGCPLQISLLLGGMAVICFAEGLTFAVLYRLSLMASDAPKGVVAAALSMGVAVLYALGIEGGKLTYVAFGLPGFAVFSALGLLAFAFCVKGVLREAIAARSLDKASAAPMH